MTEGSAQISADAQQLTSMSPKDFAVLVPVAGSALALAWEAGSFAPISGSAFGMFTITEHIVFALQAMPIALGFSLSVFLLYLQSAPTRLRRLSVPVTVIAALCGTILGIFLVVRSKMIPASFVPWATVLAIFPASLLLICWCLARGWLLHRYFNLVLIGTILEVSAFAFGTDQTRYLMQSGPISQTGTGNELISAVIIRASASGAVLYSRRADEFLYLRADQIKSRSWPPRDLTLRFPNFSPD